MLPDYVTPEYLEHLTGRWFCPSCHDFQSGKRCDHCGLPPPSPSSPEAVAQREPAREAHRRNCHGPGHEDCCACCDAKDSV